MKSVLSKLNKGHWLVIGIAAAMAIVPIVAQAKPSFAGVAPGVLTVLGVLKHAVDTSDEEGDESK